MSKILLVTGASSDIGNALISDIAVNYDVVLAHYGQSREKINALCDRIGKTKLVPLQADFLNSEEVKKMVVDILERELAPSHFVHLPAIPIINEKFSKTNWAEFESQFNVQLKSAYILCESLLPVMAKQKYGKVVFMLTENIVTPSPPKFTTSYTTAKFALLGMMKYFAAEYSGKGISINGVSPAFFASSFNAALSDLVREMNAASFPMNRSITIAEIIPTIEFLLSTGSDEITGQNIAITGGR